MKIIKNMTKRETNNRIDLINNTSKIKTKGPSGG